MNINRNIVVFLGPPGAGKGSLSKLCSQRLGWIQFSTGNVCRQHISEGTEIGKQIDFTIKSGKLISDGLITKMVADWLYLQLKNPGAVILDGFPRTRTQALALNDLLKSFDLSDIKLDIIKMVIPDSSIISRLSARYICQNNKCQAVYSMHTDSLKPKSGIICDDCTHPLIRRPDDEESAIKQRLETYYNHEKDLIEFYSEEGLAVKKLEVECPLDQVFDKLLALIDRAD